ncbi:MAG: hypothetical protein IJZ47_09595 [Oscillospiraceae bacterium]|nr:hypothetical protein [Oscillospiraceae bacterium]
MKPKKAILTLAAVTALFSAGGCDLNNNVCVYGPPPDDYTTKPRPTAVQTTTFDPAQNIPEEVYGPPIDFSETVELTAEDTSDTEDHTDETAETSDTAETADTVDSEEE